ncbi:MAG: hypothetical protein JNL98_26565 [Bryobacterales bacterium]|nr:hypothetical protein [Bryobacterales bacterium]
MAATQSRHPYGGGPRGACFEAGSYTVPRFAISEVIAEKIHEDTHRADNAGFLVMRRTHASLMNALGVSGKLVADQLGHSLDVNQNVYTQSPVESRREAVNRLEERLLVM